MGKMIEALATSQGHKVVVTIDRDEEHKFSSPEFAMADVAINFSTPDSAYMLCNRALTLHKPVVSGTTGWDQELERLRTEVSQHGGTFFYASNFSIGVNILFELNKILAKKMAHFSHLYKPAVSEVHHVHKLDAPSGTALSLAKGLMAEWPQLSRWQIQNNEQAVPADMLPIQVARQGEIVGEHAVIYTSALDTLEIKHEAHSREAFGVGVLLAAQLATEKTGLLTMSDLFAQE